MLSRIDISNVAPLKTPAFGGQRLPDEAMVPWALPKGETLAPLSAAADTPYAEVRVGGTVVATLTNNGYLTASDEVRQLLGEEGGIQGPMLAQQRAEKIAKALGGEIVKAETAMSQARWNARPPIAPGTLGALLALNTEA